MCVRKSIHYKYNASIKCDVIFHDKTIICKTFNYFNAYTENYTRVHCHCCFKYNCLPWKTSLRIQNISYKNHWKTNVLLMCR